MTTPYEDDNLLDTAEAAKILGIAEATLVKWRSTGENNIPYAKIGRACKYRRPDLRHYIERNIRNNGA